METSKGKEWHVPVFAVTGERMKPLLSLLINAHNEGPDVLQTVVGFRKAYSGPFEAVIVADGTTDTSMNFADRLPLMHTDKVCPSCSAPLEMTTGPNEQGRYWHCAACGFYWDTESKVKVIRNKERVGCGKAKQQAAEAAEGEVFIHADGHCRVLKGTLDEVVAKCVAEECVVSPGLAPLHCERDAQFSFGDTGWYDHWDGCRKNRPRGEKEMATYDRARLTYTATGGLPGDAFDWDHCSFGGKITMQPHGAKVGSKWWWKEANEGFRKRTATWFAVFAMSRKTVFDRLGGWNKYPGCWGSQEIGLALRAWFADVPIYASRNVICGHRYESDSRRHRDKDWQYTIRTSERKANHYYSHMVVFDDATNGTLWEPLWRQLHESTGGWTLILDSELKAQHEAFAKLKRKTDAEFFKTFGRPAAIVASVKMPQMAAKPEPKPAMIPPTDITAVLLQYKRAASNQKCVEAIRANGIQNVWVWCQNAVEAPKGATRVFTDSENSMTWSRWAVAALVPTPWVLFCDDDVHMEKPGFEALRRGAVEFPSRTLALIGCRFKEPYTSYSRREYSKSHEIKEAVPIDMAWPKGMLIPRDLAQRVYGRADLWQEMRRRVGSTSGDDLMLGVALNLMGEPPILVVPSDGKAYHEDKSADGEEALKNVPGRLTKKRKTVLYWRQIGFKPVLMPSDWQAAKAELVFEQRWTHFKQAIGGRIQQKQEEARDFYHDLEAAQSKVYLEVGSAWGGTLYCFAGACAKGATLIAVDDGKRLPERMYLKRVLESLKKEGFDVHWVRGNSHEPATLAQVRSILKGRLVDGGFMDGDHSEGGARQDWQDYGPLFREGAVIGFHDVLAKHRQTVKVYKVWPEIKAAAKSWRELNYGPGVVGRHNKEPYPSGIGVIVKAA